VGVTFAGRVNLSPKLFRPQQQRLPAILTHELSHAHIQGWIGETAYILRLPNWFKEGLRRGRQRATGVMLLTVSGGQER
jgi:hypothetical protein